LYLIIEDVWLELLEEELERLELGGELPGMGLVPAQPEQ
jgi:hypothetical protein